MGEQGKDIEGMDVDLNQVKNCKFLNLGKKCFIGF